jgi:adenylate kinase family enzyme
MFLGLFFIIIRDLKSQVSDFSLWHLDERGEIIGAPGVGKGTNCKRLQDQYRLNHVSVGDYLRERSRAPDRRAAMLRDYLPQGKLLPGDVLVPMLKDEMRDRAECGASRFIIDGFPRAVDQLHLFEDEVGYIQRHRRKVFYFNPLRT